MNDTRQIESPDSLELLRPRCPDCGYQVAVAMWCHDPACCSQSPFSFLIEELATAQAARGVPVLAIRYPHPLPSSYSPDMAVRVWRAGNLTPAFEGRLEDAAQFEMLHDCPAPAAASTERETP